MSEMIDKDLLISEDIILKVKSKKAKQKTYAFYIDDCHSDENFKYPNNTIKTTKYNVFTFLPKALLYQFMRPANCYFLFIAILNCIPIISPLGSGVAVVPLVVVLTASLIRELIEDIIRARLDKEQNIDIFEVYCNGKWNKVESGKLKTGQIVKVAQDAAFPADLLILTSNLPEGICYIETGTLDGEKSLKIKQSTLQTASLLPDDNIGEIKGHAICDYPNPYLYHLIGRLNVSIKGNKLEIPLDGKQLLLKGAKLRNTQWVIGIIAYAGNNTKIMLNAKKPKMKYSKIENLMNIMLLIVLSLQFIYCIIAAILHKVYYNLNLIDNDLNLNYEASLDTYCVITYFCYVILMNTMIPISLIITMEIVKIIQVIFIFNDAEGYTLSKKQSIKPNSVNLNEELGVVDYIFTDKTGTLTCNKMEFKYCVIGDVCYEYYNDSNTYQRLKDDVVLFSKGEMLLLQNESKFDVSLYANSGVSNSDTQINSILSKSSSLIDEFWKALALCHDCTIEGEGDKETYIGLSPDSIELVRAAKKQGYSFTKNDKSSIRRIKIGNDPSMIIDYEKLLLIEFNSDRKRESIVVKDRESNIRLYIKGADNIIEERLSKNCPKTFLSQSKSYVDHFASLGYRTLFIGMKIFNEKEWSEINNQLIEANLDLENKEKRLKKIYEDIEKDIYLLGATIVEDKLQDLVPETIRDLKLSGIKIWMLTGDKMSTAYNIALSCNLLNKDLKTFFLEGKEIQRDEHLKITNLEECEVVIITFGKEYAKFSGNSIKGNQSSFGIVIDEKALLTVCNNKEMSNIFLDIAKNAQSVICCRVSPLQKSEVVKLLKNNDKKKTTLAIGDGGNDVSMIMEAHIGIGIYGEEGLRAVQASDYAIGEFKILRRLLLFHGRVNNIRICDMILYFFYKNFIFTINHFFFGFYNNFSGQTIIDDWFINMYNLLFTAFSLGARACIDFDVKPDDGVIIDRMLPFLYKENKDHPIFNKLSFVMSLIKGIVHGSINYFLTIYVFYSQGINGNGDMADLWVISVSLYTSIIIIVTIDLIINTKYHTWINVAIILVLTYVAYIIFLIIVHFMTMFKSVATMFVAFGSGSFWMNIILVSSICGLINLMINTTEINFNNKISNYLRILVNLHGKIDDLTYVTDQRIATQLSLYHEYNDKETNEIENKKTHKDNVGNFSDNSSHSE